MKVVVSTPPATSDRESCNCSSRPGSGPPCSPITRPGSTRPCGIAPTSSSRCERRRDRRAGDPGCGCPVLGKSINCCPAADPVAWYTRLGAHAARAVTENRIGRTVFLSSVGAEKRSGAGEIDGLARTEEYLDATGAAVLHLRCGYSSPTCSTIDAIRDGVIRAPMALDFAQPWADPRDIGEIAAVRLLPAAGQAARSRPCTARRPHARPGRRDHQRGQSAAGYGPRHLRTRPGGSRCAPRDSAISRSMAFPG